MNRKIEGDFNYFDPETFQALLNNEVYSRINFYKTAVYSLGLTILSIATLE